MKKHSKKQLEFNKIWYEGKIIAYRVKAYRRKEKYFQTKKEALSYVKKLKKVV